MVNLLRGEIKMSSWENYIKEQNDKIIQDNIKIHKLIKEECMHKRKSNETCNGCMYSQMKKAN